MNTTTEDLRGLVHMLCQQREVPLLVTDLVADYLDYQDLFKFITISRGLMALAYPSIYRNITVDLDGSYERTRKATSLFRTLLTSESAMQAVRIISLAGEPLRIWRHNSEDNDSAESPIRHLCPPEIMADLTTFSQQETKLYDEAAAKTKMRSFASDLPVWALYLQLLCSAPHVQELSVASDYFRSPGFRDALLDMAGQGSLQQVQSCSMCLDLPRVEPVGERPHTIAVQGWDRALLSPLVAMPNLQSLAFVASLKTEAVQQLRPGASMITRLDLRHYQLQEDDLDSFLAATTNLTYLKYHAQSDYVWASRLIRHHGQPGPNPDGDGCGLEPLFDALHHLSKLQELHISHDFDEDTIHFVNAQPAEFEPVFRQKYQLSKLKQLHTLTIPYASLLGWTYKDCTWDWDQVLPPSLLHFTLTDDLQHCVDVDGWADEYLVPIFTDLVKRISQRSERAASFTLHLAKISEDFNKPVREELGRICEAHGVRCTIKKKWADRDKRQWFVPLGDGRYTRGSARYIRGGFGRGGYGREGRGRGRGRGSSV